MTTKDFTIGEKVCIKCYCRYPEPHYEDRDGVIEAIGRKYITVSINGFLASLKLISVIRTNTIV